MNENSIEPEEVMAGQEQGGTADMPGVVTEGSEALGQPDKPTSEPNETPGESQGTAASAERVQASGEATGCANKVEERGETTETTGDPSIPAAETTRGRTIYFLILAAVDIAFNAWAGSSAASVGANSNTGSSSSTAKTTYSEMRVSLYGAGAGAMKAGLLALVEYLERFHGFQTVRRIVICCLVSGMLLAGFTGTVPVPLLLAAISASLFLETEMATLNTPRPLSFGYIFRGAFAGFIFALVSRISGLDICAKRSAVWAGLTYSLKTSIRDLIFDLVKGPSREEIWQHGMGVIRKGSNNLTSWNIFIPSIDVPVGYRAQVYSFLGRTTTTTSHQGVYSSNSYNSSSSGSYISTSTTTTTSWAGGHSSSTTSSHSTYSGTSRTRGFSNDYGIDRHPWGDEFF